jgi:hypothetical protein
MKKKEQDSCGPPWFPHSTVPSMAGEGEQQKNENENVRDTGFGEEAM